MRQRFLASLSWSRSKGLGHCGEDWDLLYGEMFRFPVSRFQLDTRCTSSLIALVRRR